MRLLILKRELIIQQAKNNPFHTHSHFTPIVASGKEYSITISRSFRKKKIKEDSNNFASAPSRSKIQRYSRPSYFMQ